MTFNTFLKSTKGYSLSPPHNQSSLVFCIEMEIFVRFIGTQGNNIVKKGLSCVQMSLVVVERILFRSFNVCDLNLGSTDVTFESSHRYWDRGWRWVHPTLRHLHPAPDVLVLIVGILDSWSSFRRATSPPLGLSTFSDTLRNLLVSVIEESGVFSTVVVLRTHFKLNNYSYHFPISDMVECH